jgi:1,4-alpha-glucan branching enzyme
LLRELARELLLAQASDWPFHIRNATAPDYAAKRIRTHLARFHELATALETGETDSIIPEHHDSGFAEFDWRYFADCHRAPATSSSRPL